MTTGRNTIERALQIAGIATKNESPSADEIADGLVSLNDMLASWANNALLVYAKTWEDFTVTGGDGEYTIGSSGNFNTVRPVKIIEAHVKIGSIKYGDLSIISDAEYNRIVSDSSTLGTPQYLTYDNSFPLATIRLYPLPTPTMTLSLLSEKQITALTLDGTVSLPPGWERALKFNLAREFSGEYGLQFSPQNDQIANEALSAIKSSVARNTSLDYPSGGAESDIYSGYQ